MKLKEAIKESWGLTKSNFILMMTVLSVGMFLSMLAITPFVDETSGVSFLTGLSGVVFFVVVNLFSTIFSQIGCIVSTGIELRSVSIRQMFFNIGKVFVVLLIPMLIPFLFTYFFSPFISTKMPILLYYVCWGIFLLVGLFISFRFLFFTYYVFVFNQTVLDALKSSWMLSGRKWSLMIGLVLAGFPLFLLGVLALIVGSFISIVIYQFFIIVYFKEWTKEELLNQNK